MSAYGPLAARYDDMTRDVPYDALAAYYAASLGGAHIAVETVLDLCCGTGTLSLLLAERGFELIGVDASAEMLSEFQQKLYELPASVRRPMLLCQRAEELDLYGTVEGCVCSLDGFNYLAPDALRETLRRLRLFIAPGGALCFDYLAEERLRSLDGQCFVDEGEDFLCLWRAALEGEALHYGMDIFRLRRNGDWRRAQEEHTEYIYSEAFLRGALTAAGFTEISFSDNGPQHEQGRRFVTAIRGEA